MSKKIVSRTAAKTGRIVTIGEQRDIAVGGAGVGGLETTFSNRIGTPQGHTQQGTIVSIIGAKAEDAANTDWFRLKARYTGTGTDCTDQSEWCRAFNVSATQQISAATLRKFLIYSIEFAGEGFTLIDNGPSGFTVSPLIGYRVEMLFAKPGQRNRDGSVAHCAGYRVRDTTGKLVGLYDSEGFPESGDLGGRLVRFWEPHMSDPFRPHSRVMAAGLSIDVVHAANLAVRSFMQNCGTPGGIVTVGDDSFTEESIIDLDNRLNSKLTDPTRKGRYLVVGADLDVKPVADSAPSKGWADLSTWARDDIRAIWGIPETRLAQGGNKTYENADVENKQWYRGPVFAALTNFANTINLISRPQGIEHYFDMADVPELTVDDGSLLRATTLFDSKLAVRNEARGMVGLPPVAGGDEFSEAPPPPAPTPPANADVPAGRDAVPFVRAAQPHALAVSLDEIIDTCSEEFAHFAQGYHVRVYKRFAGALKRAAGVRDATSTPLPAGDVSDFFHWGQFDAEQHTDAEKKLHDAAEQTLGMLAAYYGVKSIKDLPAKGRVIADQLRALLDGTPEHLGWNGAINRDLQSIIERGRATDMSVEEALARSADTLGVDLFTDGSVAADQELGSRAIQIAINTIHSAINNLALETYRSQGQTLKAWQSMGDDKVRDTHEEADSRYSDEPIQLDQPFEVGDSQLMFPGDPDGPPEEVYNCRCVVVPVDPSEQQSS